MTDLMAAWNRSYGNRDNFVFYPHEEVIRFVARHIRKRVGLDDFIDCKQQAASSKQQRILDFGCGIGRHVIFLRELGLQAYGIDLSQAALETARTWAAQRGFEQAEDYFCQGDVSSLPWPDRYFDYAVSHGVLDSMPFATARSGCAELSRAMVPGGLFYCDLISGDNSGHAREYTGEEVVTTEHENGTIQSYFNMARIEELFRDSFAVEECVLIRREDVVTGGYGSRYHLVLRNLG